MLSLAKLIALLFIVNTFSINNMAYAAAERAGKEASGSNDHGSSTGKKSPDDENKKSTNQSDDKLSDDSHHAINASAQAIWNEAVISNDRDLNYKIVRDSVYWNDHSNSSVPEPEIYAMLVAGLSLLGFIARRKKNT